MVAALGLGDLGGGFRRLKVHRRHALVGSGGGKRGRSGRIKLHAKMLSAVTF